jgi:DNA-directed RNA polymerase specialized sigma24 family protein
MILKAYLENELALKRYLARFIRSREAADDLAQEAFVRAFAAESKHPIEAPKAFLFKVSKNLALNELARQSSAAIEPLGDFEGQAVLEDSSQAAVDDVVDSRERIRLSRCRAYMRAHGGTDEEGSGSSRIFEGTPTAFVKAKEAK